MIQTKKPAGIRKEGAAMLALLAALGLLFGMAFTGCDSSGGDDGGNNGPGSNTAANGGNTGGNTGGAASALVGYWYAAQDAARDGDEAGLRYIFKNSGALEVYGSPGARELRYTAANGTIITMLGETFQESAAYSVTGGAVLAISGAAGQSGLTDGAYYKGRAPAFNGVDITGKTLRQALAQIMEDTAPSGKYRVTLGADEDCEPLPLGFSGRAVEITLRSGVAKRTVKLAEGGALFTVKRNVTLNLEHILLVGKNGNSSALIRVEAGGALVMNDGAIISSNTNSSSSSAYGGGVYNSGTFTMNGGIISGNTAYTSSSSFNAYGGGVCNYGTFIMRGGIISGNTAANSSYYYNAFGGGVCSDSGTFTMSGGTISGNTGYGVYVNSSSTFTKESTGGVIYGTDAEEALKNSSGAVYKAASPAKYRSTTVGESEGLSVADNGTTTGTWN